MKNRWTAILYVVTSISRTFLSVRRFFSRSKKNSRNRFQNNYCLLSVSILQLRFTNVIVVRLLYVTEEHPLVDKYAVVFKVSVLCECLYVHLYRATLLRILRVYFITFGFYILIFIQYGLKAVFDNIPNVT